MRAALNLIFLALLAVYIAFYFISYPSPLFSDLFAGNDARQQLFPLYRAINSDAFEGDLIYTSMKGYLAPLHYYLSYAITLLTQSPIMTGHWVMMIQLTLTVVFVFLAVAKISSPVAASFSVAWLFNSPNLIRNFYGGLPRGWAGVIISSFLYFLITKNHRAVLMVIIAGCLLHPHSTFLVAMAYGLYLSIALLFAKKDRPAALRPLLKFIMVSPFIYLLAHYVVQRPPEIGEMVSFEQAAAMPEFSKGGRFPFLPFEEPLAEIKRIGFKTFFDGARSNRGDFATYIYYAVPIFYIGSLAFQLFSRRKIIAPEFVTFLLAVITCYFLARQFAFKLYVPARYLNWPLGLFFILTLPSALWNLIERKSRSSTAAAAFALCLFAAAVYTFSGDGLGGRTNFKPGRHFDSPLYTWMRQNTPSDALIAGHPTQLDGAQLYGVRKAFVTTETAHPFYDKYNLEMKRRLGLVFKAHFSRSLAEFMTVLEEEGIDYFVFGKGFFAARKGSPGKIKEAGYYKPYDELVSELTSYPAATYLFKEFSNNPQFAESIAYQNREVLVISRGKLSELAAEPSVRTE